jgi:diguanylate cyclase (GGDEF)-like protein
MSVWVNRSPERYAVANQLLKVLVVFGFFAIVSDYLNGNLVMVAGGTVVTVLAAIVLIIGKRPRYHALPLVLAAVLIFVLYLFGVFTQIPEHPGKMAWVAIFPFVYFYVLGLRSGLLLSILSVLLMPLAYWFYQFWGSNLQTTVYDLLQGMGAFVLATVLAYKYEQVRSDQARLLKQSAEYDLLTGLLNRRGFANFSEAVFSQAIRFKQPFSVIFLDLDNFKQLNDSLGHDAGDALLKEVAALLRSITRTIDVTARWGGEEFVMLLMQSDVNGSRQVGKKICSAISAHNFSVGKFTVSVGVAVHEDGERLEETIKRADQSMYQAKKLGKNRVEFLAAAQNKSV